MRTYRITYSDDSFEIIRSESRVRAGVNAPYKGPRGPRIVRIEIESDGGEP